MVNFFSKKFVVDGIKFDSLKEYQFYQRFIKNSGYKFVDHPSYKVLDLFSLGGWRQRGISYAPDFVVYDDDGEIKHIYDVKTSIAPQAITTGSKIRMILFQFRYRKAIEIVTPRKNDFKMVLINFTVKEGLLDRHAKKDRHGNIKTNKKGKMIYDYYNVYKDIDYDIREIVGW